MLSVIHWHIVMSTYDRMSEEKSSLLLQAEPKHPSETRLHGILWFMGSGLFSVLINSLIRLLSSRFGYHPMQLVFFYSVMGATMYLPVMLRDWRQCYTPVPRFYLMRSALEVAGFSFSFYALQLKSLPFSMFTTLMFTTPIIGSVAAVWCLGELMTRHKWLGLLMGFTGILIVAHPDTYAIPKGIILPLLASLCFAFCAVCIRTMSLHGEPPQRIAFLTLTLMALITFPLALAHWQTPTLAHIPYLALLAVMAGIVQFCVGSGLKRIKLTTAQPLMFLNLIWSSLLGWILFGEQVAFTTVLGGICIVGGILLSLKRMGPTMESTQP